jgi:hypothetical protein
MENLVISLYCDTLKVNKVVTCIDDSVPSFSVSKKCECMKYKILLSIDVV